MVANMRTATDPVSAEFLAHEVRSLAGAVQAVLQLVVDRSDASLGPKLFSMLKVQADSLVALVDSMLVRPTSLEVQARTLPEVVRSTVHELESVAMGKGLELLIDTANVSSCTRTPADCVAVARIVRNLLANAIKFTSAGSIRVAIERGSGVIAISVTDSGPGMSETQMSRLFRPYAPGTEPGSCTGLGLWMSNELARRLGGHIHVESELGIGSCFTLLIPSDASVG